MRTFSQAASLIILAVSTAALGYFISKKAAVHSKVSIAAAPKPAKIDKARMLSLKKRDERLSKVSADLQSFSKGKGYNNRIAFLIDMSIVSGENRFFIYNMTKDSIEKSALVTHGYGSQKDEIEFSNVPGSYCTSLGKYKVGGAYNGRFGLAYKLHGLDKTNDKAFERFVVLHAHDCVPAEEVAPLQICESQGCPTVAPSFLQELKKYIEASDKPILLNIYK